jgi:C-terminal processing protease CtpA/Prc
VRTVPAGAAEGGANAVVRKVDGNPPQRRYGIMMAPPRGGESRLPVLDLVEGEIAAEAGVQPGDAILRLNGTPVSEIPAAEFLSYMRASPLTLVVDRDGETLTFEMALDGTPSTMTEGGARPEAAASADYAEAAVELAGLLEDRYLFPDVGARYAETLQAHADAGRYSDMASPADFANQVTSDLAAVSRDNHLKVLPATGRPPGLDSEGDDPASFGVRESGRLDGGVAFLRLGLMADSPAGQAWTDAFMREHADAEALILDLRRCPGGALNLMNGFLPYLYDAPTHLLTMDMRRGADDETEAWFDDIPELRRVEADKSILRWEHWIEPAEDAKPDMPVYVLTDFTGSACEHLAAALKATDRATVIGGPTGGAGHFVAFHDFGDAFSVVLPIGRTYDPETGEGWEGDGIAPDVAVDPADAEAEALRRIAGGGN